MRHLPARAGGARAGGLLIELPLALSLALLLVYLALRARAGDSGLALVDDHHAALFVDHLRGTRHAVDGVGARVHLPWLQELVRLDRRPRTYVMEGDEHPDPDHVPALVVRGRDGASFAFARVEIQYALDPARFEAALEDRPGGGLEPGRLDLYARPLLRAAFGRHTSREILLPDRKQAATAEALALLADALAVHGLAVLELSVSKPRFPAKVEETMRRGEAADLDAAKLDLEREQLLAGLDDRLARVELEQGLALARLEEELADALRAAQRDAQRARQEAQLYAQGRRSTGELLRDEKLAQAAARAEVHAKEVEGFRARTEALAAQGPLAVRAALVERLATIPFELVPVRDPVRAPVEDAVAPRARQAGTHGTGGGR